FILNRYTTIKMDGRKKQVENPKEKWNVFKNHHPGIVSEEEWIKANSKEVVRRTKISPWNVFRGLMTCGKCKYNMIIMQSWKKNKKRTKKRWRYLKCSAYRRAGKHGCVNHVPIRYENFKQFIIDRLKEKGNQIEFNFKNSFIQQNKKDIITLNKK